MDIVTSGRQAAPKRIEISGPTEARVSANTYTTPRIRDSADKSIGTDNAR